MWYSALQLMFASAYQSTVIQLNTRGKMASETFDERNLPGHKNGDLGTKSYLATKVITMVKLLRLNLAESQNCGPGHIPGHIWNLVRNVARSLKTTWSQTWSL